MMILHKWNECLGCGKGEKERGFGGGGGFTFSVHFIPNGLIKEPGVGPVVQIRRERGLF